MILLLCSLNHALDFESAAFKHTSSVIMHLSLSHTLAVVSQEPLNSVPNFPADKVQTVSTVSKVIPGFISTTMAVNTCFGQVQEKLPTCVFVSL